MGSPNRTQGDKAQSNKNLGSQTQLRGSGHVNVKGRHAKTFELVREPHLSEGGTCIIGVNAAWNTDELLKLRGTVRIDLTCGAISDSVEARMNPLFIGSDPLIVRTHPEPQHRSVCIGATKGASSLNADLIDALQSPDAELEMTITEIAPPYQGALFLVGMAVGNPPDLSPRAEATLRSADIILSSNPRAVRQALGEVRGEITSFSVQNAQQRISEALAALSDGRRVALVLIGGVTVAGDFGPDLVREAAQNNFPVASVLGPDVAMAALALSGLPTADFRFIGALPSKASARARTLELLRDAPYSAIMTEEPRCVIKTLRAITAILGQRQFSVCRNLTRANEETLRGNAEEIVEILENRDAVRGDFTLVIGPSEVQRSAAASDETILLVNELLRGGVSTKTIANAIAKSTGGKRRDAFQLIVKLKDELDMHQS